MLQLFTLITEEEDDEH